MATLDEITKRLEEEKNKPSEADNAIYQAIIGLAPTLIGAAVGGKRGALAGSQAGELGMKTLTASREATKKEEEKKAELARAAEKELKAAQKDAEKFAFEKEKFAKEQANKLAELEIKKQDTLAKTSAPADTTQKMVKLGAEGKARLDNARAGFSAVQNMMKALDEGQNTFSAVGDNDFTMSRSIFEEALGRMQSGGAITKDEENRFKKMAPTITDSKEMQKKKLQMLTEEMRSRMGTLGFSPEEFGLAAYTPQKEFADQSSLVKDFAASLETMGSKDAVASPVQDPVISRVANENGISYSQAEYIMKKRGYGAKTK